MGAVKQKYLEDLERGGYESWHELAVAMQDEGHSDKEQQFLENMVKLTVSGRVPTKAQQAWLCDIYERYEEGQYLDQVYDN